jgi:hypothetical protein
MLILQTRNIKHNIGEINTKTKEIKSFLKFLETQINTKTKEKKIILEISRNTNKY